MGNQTSVKKEDSFRHRFIRHNKYIILASVILIFVFGYFFLIKPKYEEIKAVVNETVALKGEIAMTQNEKSSLEALHKQYEKIGLDDINKINKILPEISGIENILAKMETIVERNGLILESVEASEDKSVARREGDNKEKSLADSLGSGVGKIKIVLDVAGVDYRGLKMFLTNLENDIRITDVYSVKFSADSKKASLEMYTYFFK